MASERDFKEQLAAVIGSAVHFDTAGVVEAAVYYYNQALGLLSGLDFSADQNLATKYKEYSDRAEALKRQLDAQASRVDHETDAQREKGRVSMTVELERAYFLMSEALDADEDGNRQKEALEQYSEAVEVCLEARKRTSDKDIQEKLAKVATQALERAEVLKAMLQPKKTEAAPPAGATAASFDLRRLPLGLDPLSLSEKASEPRPAAAGTAKGSAYTEEEKRVLATTSMINGREYVPFLSRDTGEKFAFSVPFSDRHGKLALAPKQKSKLVRWARPDEFMSDPKVVASVDCFCVKQVNKLHVSVTTHSNVCELLSPDRCERLLVCCLHRHQRSVREEVRRETDHVHHLPARQKGQSGLQSLREIFSQGIYYIYVFVYSMLISQTV
jgi:calpain-7